MPARAASRPRTRRDASRQGALLRSLLSVAVVGAVTLWEAGLAASSLSWYAGLLKPAFAPPPWLAGLTSLGLGALLAAALSRALGTPDYLPDRPLALRLFGLALGLDALWSFLFFGGRHPTVALAAAAALMVASVLAGWRFARLDRGAGLMLLPWTLAAGFVFLLDLSIALRNG